MRESFLDGTKIDSFFKNNNEIDINQFNNKYYLSNYCNDNKNIVTNVIQDLIDDISDNGGGLLIVDNIYHTGALYFKNNVNLCILENAKLIGSNNINDYPLCYTRIEGESGLYFPALLNFIGVSNTYIFGKGIIDGNGLNSWKSFWTRREWNDKATNKDEQRPRLIYVSNSFNVNICGLTLINSPFWNIHIYKSEYIKLTNLNIYSPEVPVKAPSTDGIDIDYARYVLISNNTFDVNDDAIALKGGKGAYADKDFHNGINEYIIIEDNNFKFCHSCLTLGSESIHNKDIIFSGIDSIESNNIIWFKVRPDTPQIYENVLVEDIKGYSKALIYIWPWTQFFDLKGRDDAFKNIVRNIHISNAKLECDNFFKVTKSDQYILKDFYLNDLDINCLVSGFDINKVDNLFYKNININEKYKNLEEKVDEISKRFISEHIKTVNKYKEKVIVVSNQYNGIWLEHVYDSIMYGNLFDDFSIAKNTINLFLDLMNDKGQYPCFIKDKEGVGYSQLQECVSFARLGLIVYRKTNDQELLEKLYNGTKKWVDFLYKYRMTLGKGLVEMFVGYDTGHDNSARLDNMKYKTYYSIDGIRQDASIKPDSRGIIAVDLNCNLYMTLKSLHEMAIILNDSNNIDKYDMLARRIKKNLFKECLSKEDSFFYDRDSNGLRKYRSSQIFMLFQERVLDKEKDKELIDLIYNKYIKNPKEFYTEYPFPSMSISDPSFKDHKMPNSWGYYSQALIALRCSLWMDYYGYKKEYDHILYKWLDRFIKYYDDMPFGQELDPISGECSGASLNYSTSILLFLYAIRRLKIVKSHDIIPTF